MSPVSPALQADSLSTEPSGKQINYTSIKKIKINGIFHKVPDAEQCTYFISLGKSFLKHITGGSGETHANTDSELCGYKKV